MAESERLITAAKLRELYGGISAMTLWRWEKAGIIAPDAVIRGRKYYGAGKHPRALCNQQRTEDSPRKRNGAVLVVESACLK